MRQVAILAAIAAVATIGFARAEESRGAGEWQPGEPRGPLVAGVWTLESDDSLDGALAATTSQLLVLESANGQVVGRCKDRPADGNSPLFSGTVVPGAPRVVTLRQDDLAGHVAVYVGHVISEGRIAGSFADNRGRGGDWSLTLVTGRFIEPSAGPPDAVLLESVLGVYGRAIRGDRHPFINLRPPHRDLWTEEIQEVVQGTLPYGEVDYIGTAKLVIAESGTYMFDIPGAGVECRVNGQRVEAGDVELKEGMYDVEIYTNHWGQPYLTYAEVTVYKQGTEVRIPFVNTVADIEAFRSQKIAGRPVVEACQYVPARVDPEQH